MPHTLWCLESATRLVVFGKCHTPYRVWREPHSVFYLESATVLVVFGVCHTPCVCRAPHSLWCLECHTLCRVWRLSLSCLESATLLIVYRESATLRIVLGYHTPCRVWSVTLVTFGECHTHYVWRVPHSVWCLESATLFVVFGYCHCRV